MPNTDNEFEELKSLLIGKTISKIEKAGPEGVCKFYFTDKSSFILMANDLGWWIECKKSK